ncbi:MAG: UPF0280 family protein [Burkholderiaceae bacterium]
MTGPVRARFAGGRWHFQHGPIDLVIGAEGERHAVAAAVEDCWAAFADVLPALVAELPQLRSPCAPALRLKGPVAREMLRACRPFAHDFGLFITPMAAVAGAVADHLIACFRRPGVTRAYVNNGGDIALHLTAGAAFDIGVVADIAAPRLDGGLRIEARDPVRGVATSGWRGRSFSLGIADSVTVLAGDAAAADAAATIIANHVDVDSPLIGRAPANSLRDDTDLGERLVTVDVPPLPPALVDRALDRGAAFARTCLERGLIHGALLTVQGASRILTEHEIAALA